MLLQLHTLGDDGCLQGLSPSEDSCLNFGVLVLSLLLGSQEISSGSDGVHVLSLQKVIEWVKLEAFVKELDVNIVGEAQKTDGLILDLGDKGLVVLILVGNQLSNEVLSIGLSDGL